MTSNQIEAFLTFLRDCEQRYHMAEADEQEANAITNDILHALELKENGEAELLRLRKVSRGRPEERSSLSACLMTRERPLSSDQIRNT